MKDQLVSAMAIVGGATSITFENGLTVTQNEFGWHHSLDLLGAVGTSAYSEAELIVRDLNELSTMEVVPEPMLIFCPVCHRQHVDEPDPAQGWDNPPHNSHLCHGCGHTFRLADMPTTGVANIKTKGSRDTWDMGSHKELVEVWQTKGKQT
jgi:hypothetical protein